MTLTRPHLFASLAVAFGLIILLRIGGQMGSEFGPPPVRSATLPSGEPGQVNDGGASLADRIARAIRRVRDRKAEWEPIVTGATDAPPAPTPVALEGEKPSSEPLADTGKNENAGLMGSEATLLERLSHRRSALDQREKELDDREALIAAAERRLDARVAELKALEAEIKAAADARQASLTSLKPLVVMYETMKPKDAAKIFEKLDLKELLPIVEAMNPRKFSDVLAQMDPVLSGKVTASLEKSAREKASPRMATGGQENLNELAEIKPKSIQ